MISDTLRREALNWLDQSFELHVMHSSARWQMTGRSAIRFDIEYDQAALIYDALRTRFHTRCPTGGTRILTPDPRDGGSPETAYYAEPRQQGEDVRLTAKWYTVHALSQATGLDKKKLSQALHKRAELFTRMEEAPADYKYHQYGEMITVYANEDLAAFLEDRQLKGTIAHASCEVSFDGIPRRIVLRQRWYSFNQLADLLDITYSAVDSWRYQNPDVLTVEKRRAPHTNKTVNCIRTDGALVETIRTVWKHPDVEIGPDIFCHDWSHQEAA